MSWQATMSVCLAFSMAFSSRALGGDAKALRLVPFPKKVEIKEGTFDLNRPLVAEVSVRPDDPAVQLIAEELKRAGLPEPKVKVVNDVLPGIRLVADAAAPRMKRSGRGDTPRPEGYDLAITPSAVECLGHGGPGAFYAAGTLCQLIRANRVERTKLPCLSISDWPSLRWRCYQDDMTRGPSSTLDTLKREVLIGAALKMNLFTYYMEHQYAFKKHPQIGPKDGSLEPEDLKALVAFAKPYQTDILGNQQSFGHFGGILRHKEFAPLGENPGVLSPAIEGTYKLLDDMYSEICPLLPFEMFNVCCDETYGLGEGPSKELAAKIGPGGVYVQHIRRIHDLLKDKYKKRMMMWGDIILQHPDKLDQIPKDTVMLTWAYDPRANFESQIVPFAKSGYEFFVCPGVSNWSRILPDFYVTTINVRNFVRDGAKHGALGMLNTDWEDDSESLQGNRWHGHAWGAECAWNASTTTPEEFNRRIGAVLFGEKGDHFGQAIELLSKPHGMPGMEGMNNRRFWENDFRPARSAPTIKASATRLLAVVRPGIEHLEACKKEATVNADLLDDFLQGARRMELIGQRMLDGLEATELYWQACASPRPQAIALLDRIEKLARTNRDAHEALGREFSRLWLAACKPYALDRTMDRYAATVKWYDQLLARLADARKAVEAGRPLPDPEQMGLMPPESFTRRTRPLKIEPAPLAPEAPWIEPSAAHRVGLVVKAGAVDRVELPVEVDLVLPPELAARPVRAFWLRADAQPQEVAAQLDPGERPGTSRLVLVVPGPIAAKGEAQVQAYLGLGQTPQPLPQAVRTTDAPKGMKWIENEKVRLLLGPEGAHVYRWEVKSLKGRDLTQPGEQDWFGFSDVSGHRNLPHKLTCTARGPALVRYVATDETGLVKTINVFAGASWMEVILDEPVGGYWDFDATQNFAADGPAPGEYLFSNGQTGPVGRQADGVNAQVKAGQAHWAVKFNKQKLAVGLVTPDMAAALVIAPGSGAGGVGMENSRPVGHFVTYGGLLAAEPKQQMEQLRQTLAFGSQPRVVLYAVQGK
jgi:hexosaminidase